MQKGDNTLTAERNAALFEAYKKARARLYNEAKDWSDFQKIHSRAVVEAIHTPQPRFWLTQYRTYKILRLMVNKKMSPEDFKTWATRKGMHEELINTYYRLSKKLMFRGMSLWFTASFVTFEPSSGFFMSYHRAIRAIKAELKKRHEST